MAASKPLPALPQELIDNILDLAMPSTLTVHVNCYQDPEEKYIFRVHATSIDSLLAICARLRLSTYQRVRAIKALNTTTTLFVDMISNSAAMNSLSEHPSSAITSYNVSDEILGEIWQVQFREAASYHLKIPGLPYYRQHLLTRRLTLSTSKRHQGLKFAIDNFRWEYAAPYLSSATYDILRKSRMQHENRLRHGFDKGLGLLPKEIGQISGKMLWFVQQYMWLSGVYHRDAQGGVTGVGSREEARECYAQVEKRGFVWEVEM
ncbi:hypothetical protein CLAFUW4_10646 [Fulvia fulva]|uniref:Uncharacterized protein n=1 Tax=Passalora fulva TaxID=5499 RepID=A0A9Q8P8M2_PASFU|nr:uncharacterized protein CLAFUR5_05259 [Fulvia fulva]KAK4615686.1 hypothetical protein CLAFUR4_10651 [Fulvia fulva]KAK4616956.1 hypothetical protein CLAFUR0_10593 [Fulvia fulva]UJO17041.1 hypothetical protein CLAFUR5_05259 [Fulvia fulva]WPV19377.1 hypothetical protein CLAFUW4_10646 [Fulvia fulva]WPV34410.1 hypothetical protein CLAFUW7_10648 [Fulvia fulva]